MKKRLSAAADWLHGLGVPGLTLLIFALHLPYLAAYWPGLMIYDTTSSIMQFYGLPTFAAQLSGVPGAVLTNHHMAIFTLLMGGAVRLGELMGSQNAGFFLYALLQLLLTDFAMAYALDTLRSSAGKGYLAALAFYGLFPLCPLWAIAVCKDSMYSAFFLLLVCQLVRVMAERGEALARPKTCAALFMTALAVCLTKQQGVYILLACGAVTAITCRKRFVAALLSLTLPAVLVMTLVTGMLLPALGVVTGGRQEMFGALFQQTARIMLVCPEDVTPQERAVIDRILPVDELASLYQPGSQDDVKFSYRQSATGEDLAAYLSVWLRQLLRHPDVCVTATLLNVRDFFLPTALTPRDYRPYLLEDTGVFEEIGFSLQNAYPPVIFRLVEGVTWRISQIPLLRAVYMKCTFVWASLLALLCVAIRRRGSMLVALLPCLLSVLLLFITPLADIRYILPLIYTLPVMACAALGKCE